MTVTEAADIIFSNPYNPRVGKIPLQQSVNRVLAEVITADRDFPPFDRVSMDGIAIKYQALKDGARNFPIEFLQPAGSPKATLNSLTGCVEVMTGAILPDNTDTVIRYEDLDIKDNVANLVNDKVEPGQNVHRKGIDCKENDVLLESGILLSAAEVALLASVGKTEVQVFEMPKTAIISSGNELVDVKDVPLLHQIRRSNTYAIEAGMRMMNLRANHFHFPDDKTVLLNSLENVLNDHELLILSGGVSKGKFDFIPKVLEELGVKKLFHQVDQRPGKPFWFGCTSQGKTVFALPGNPVSTYMCFYRYVVPWMMKSLGIAQKNLSALLANDFSFAPKLTYFLQVEVKIENGKLLAYPYAGGGSGDFVNLKDVTGFLELPAEQTQFKAGEIFPYYPFRNL